MTQLATSPFEYELSKTDDAASAYFAGTLRPETSTLGDPIEGDTQAVTHLARRVGVAVKPELETPFSCEFFFRTRRCNVVILTICLSRQTTSHRAA